MSDNKIPGDTNIPPDNAVRDEKKAVGAYGSNVTVSTAAYESNVTVSTAAYGSNVTVSTERQRQSLVGAYGSTIPAPRGGQRQSSFSAYRSNIPASSAGQRQSSVSPYGGNVTGSITGQEERYIKIPIQKNSDPISSKHAEWTEKRGFQAHHHSKIQKAELNEDSEGIPCISWTAAYKKHVGSQDSSKVPLMKMFVLYCPKRVETVRLKIFGLEVEMKKGQSENDIYKQKVYIPSDFPDGEKYTYEIIQPGRLYGTRTTQCDRSFKLYAHETNRDFWNEENVDGVLAHIDDISCTCNLELNETYLQVNRLLLPLNSQDKKKLFFRKFGSNYCRGKSESLPTEFCLLLCCADDLDDECFISSELASQLLGVSQISKLSLTYSEKHKERFLTILCKNASNQDTYIMTELFYVFCWTGREKLLDRLKSRKGSLQSIPANKENVEFMVHLIQEIYWSDAFKNQPTREIMSLIIQDFPSELAITAFVTLMKIESEEESCTTLKALIKEELLARMKKKLTILGEDKMTKFLILWKQILDCGEDHLPFKAVFEECLLKLVSLPKLQKTETVLDITEGQKLFVTPESRKKLLEMIVSSPNHSMAELFIRLASKPGFNEVLSDLDETIYEKWFNGIPKKQSIEDTAKRLLSVVTLPKVSEREAVIDIVRKILFKELRKTTLLQVLKKAVDFASVSKENSVLIRCFKDYLVEKVGTMSETGILFEPLLSNGVLHLQKRIIADIACLLIDKFGKIEDELPPTEQFFKAVEQRQLWGVIFAADGQYKGVVEDHPHYKRTCNCIKMTTDRLSNLEIDFKLMKRINESKNSVVTTLSLFEKKEWVEELLLRNQQILHAEEDRIKVVEKVISALRYQSINLPDCFDEFSAEIENKRKSFYGGEINGRGCHVLWKEMTEIPEYCQYLETVINSVVYWNLSRDVLTSVESDESKGKGFIKNESDSAEDDKVAYQRVSENETETQHEQNTVGDDGKRWSASIKYMEKLRFVCMEKYRQEMEGLIKMKEVSMTQILRMFKCKSPGPDLDMERQVVDSMFPQFCESIAWTTLKQIYSIEDIRTKVEGMHSFLKVFRDEVSTDVEFSSALNSFSQLIKGNVNDFDFLQVKTSLDTMYSITSQLSDQTFDIMKAIGQCSSLVVFLKETVDEDIRNLIDAVEDISEQQVRESTVSGLIELKQMLFPILKQESDVKCQQTLNLVEQQAKKISKIASIPAKIYDCMDNLHNLKSLYNNVANRGEQTKQIVKNIISCGIFCFFFDDKFGKVLVEVKYKKNETLMQKKMTELIDLRSRSLLLMNTESKSSGGSDLTKQEVETFVGYVDQCIEVADLYTQLYTSGHFMYSNIGNKEIPHLHLAEKSESHNKELIEWREALTEEREHFYLLNFIHGFGLHSMYQYLNLCENMSAEDREVLEDTAYNILVFIHTGMKADDLKRHFEREKGKQKTLTIKDWLKCLGTALHAAYPDPSTTIEKGILKQQKDIESLKMTDVVQEGKLFVAQLDENSSYTVSTVLALYANTVQCMPEPHQILFCTQETTVEEIELLIERCREAKTFYKSISLYCIANIELLQSELYIELLDGMRRLQEDNNSFLLALVCRGTNSHPIIDELSEFKMTIAPVTDNFVHSLFKSQHSDIFTLTSDLAGLGKSSRIVKHAHRKGKAVKVLHVSGCARKGLLIERILALKVKSFHVLHIDIGILDDPKALDTFIFELVILGYASLGRSCIALKSKHVYIEIANTINNTLRNSLQTTMLLSREHISWHEFDDFVVSKEKHSAVQITCKYFDYLEKGYLDKKDIQLDEMKPLSTKKCRRLLKTFLNSKDDMSFPVVNASLQVLANQFKKMSCSPFFRVARLQDMTGNKQEQKVKSSLVRVMIDSTRAFASRSVSSCRTMQMSTITPDTELISETLKTMDLATIVTERIKGMVRWEDCNHLMFVFHCQNIQTLSPLYRDKQKVPDTIKTLFESQMNKELQDFKAFSQDELQDLLQKIARENPLPLPRKKLRDMASEYALTPDNLLKMVLILLRIKAKVPVIIMGETGCGKTSLVRYLASICEVQFDVMNIHAGVSESSVKEKVRQNCLIASSSLDSEHWLFLDEINTSESIGMMTEIICHHKCLGESLPPNLFVMGACNPYKLRTTKDIATAGLTMKSRNDELSRLVYRVLPLPEKMVDYVWDFGSLNENDEKLYIQRMVEGLFEDENYHCLFTDMLSASQSFVRQKQESAYVVSLRDVYRCRLLTKWFLQTLEQKKPIQPYTLECKNDIRAMILALTHCYHSRFQSKTLRSDYRNILRAKLKEHRIPGFEAKQDKIDIIIHEEQNDFLFRMELPTGTACNTALVENVFVIIVCIYNRLPVFVVGKPGCSKSLAMQVIRSNLRGKDSKDKFFKTLPQLYCVSFQGSESSSSDGIIKVFEKAEKYQSSNSADDVLSVVILDEIGLAEVSRFNPLKVLHNLLEPDGEMRPRVAVVGLSNWSLDASKMNRAIHLSRTDMDEEELFETAKAIGDSFTVTNKTKSFPGEASFLEAIQTPEEKNVFDRGFDFSEMLRGIANSYYIYSEKLRFKNFHGLRDFYALVKYVIGQLSSVNRQNASIQKTGQEAILKPSAVVKSGLERNFGGLPPESTTLHEAFDGFFHFDTKERQNVLNLITENVGDKMARHLMLITTGDSALGILEQELSRTAHNKKEIIYGSQFEDDLTDDYHYRILSRIILCMEEGLVLILKDLDSIYGSLYDMLNQNYTIIGNKKNCRVALGAYSNPICHVADSFRCIVLIDESKLGSCDPPFLNRFEKQYLRFSDILSSDQIDLVHQLKTWVEGLRVIQDRFFEYTDIFPIYSEDLLASLILKIERECEIKDEINNSQMLNFCKQKLMWLLKPEAVIRLKKSDSEKIVDDADEIKKTFFQLPLHRGFQKLISFQLSEACIKEGQQGILTIVFTKSNMHINLQKCLSTENLQTEKIGAFKSEKQMSAKIKQFWSDDTKADILLLQCSAVDDDKHILLTKSIIERHRASYYSVKEKRKHVYLIIHVSANKGVSEIVSQINFMSDWNLVMLDSLECPQTDLPQLCSMDILEAVENKRPLDKCLTKLLFWSFTRIKYSPLGRDVNSIQDVLTKMKNSTEFLCLIDEEIWRYISKSETHERDWQVKVACDLQALRTSLSFVDALEQHILQVIRIPLTKILFRIEELGILDSFFIQDESSDERKQVWIRLVRDEGIFSLEKIPEETGPECYSCETADCGLRMPFSKIIFNQIESQKDEFIEDMSVLKGNFDVDDSDDLPHSVICGLLEKKKHQISFKVSDWMHFCYENCEKDYIHDFSSMMSVNICSGMRWKKRAFFMQWIISQKTDLPVKTLLDVSYHLHSSVWMNISLFCSEMQLLAVCVKVGLEEKVLDNMMCISRSSTSDEQRERNENINSDYSEKQSPLLNAEVNLVQGICKELIPTRETVTRYNGILNWQRTVDAILALAARVSTESDFLYSLRVCSEAARTVIIPLQLDTDMIYPLGDILVNNTEELDSEEVFVKVMDIIAAGLNKGKSAETNCYRLLSSYIFRCTSKKTETETAVLKFLFQYIVKHEIPEKMIHHFRKPLYCAVDLECTNLERTKLLSHSFLNFSKSPQEEKEVSSKSENETLHRTRTPHEGKKVSNISENQSTDRSELPQGEDGSSISENESPDGSISPQEREDSSSISENESLDGSKLPQEEDGSSISENESLDRSISSHERKEVSSISQNESPDWTETTHEGKEVSSKSENETLDRTETTQEEKEVSSKSENESLDRTETTQEGKEISSKSENETLDQTETTQEGIEVSSKSENESLDQTESPLEGKEVSSKSEKESLDWTEKTKEGKEVSSKSENETLDRTESSQEVKEKSFEGKNMLLVVNFDEFLQDLAGKKRENGPFVLLIVDVLEEQFKNILQSEVFDSTSSSRFQTIFDCHKRIIEENFGISYISALTYIKTFLSLLGELNMWDYKKNREYWNIINIILSDVKPNHISMSILMHFIKSISKGLSTHQIKGNIEAIRENHDFLENIAWTPGYLHFDENPFCSLLHEEQHGKYGFCHFGLDIVKAEEKLTAFLNAKVHEPQELQMMFGFVLSKFLISKTFETSTKDTVKEVLSQFLEKVKQHDFTWYCELKFLSGARDFQHHLFDLELNSKYINYNAQCVLLHFFILLMTHAAGEGENRKSVFLRCLKSPLEMKRCPLPGFPDSRLNYGIEKDCQARLATCDCGSRIAFHNCVNENENTMKCVFCSGSLVCENTGSQQLKTSVSHKDQINSTKIHPFTLHLLQMLTHGCLLGSLAFEFSSKEEIKDLTVDELSISSLTNSISEHWNHLRRQLNLDDHSLGTLIQVLIFESKQLFVKYDSHPYTDGMRTELEKTLDRQIGQLMNGRSEVVRSKIHEHHKLHSVQDSSFENFLSETGSLEKQTTMSLLLFRSNSKPTKENFIFELSWKKSDFPFLCLFLQFEKKLGLPQHIYSIIQWHLAAIASINYMLKKHECLEMTAQDFIYWNKKRKDILKARFTLFMESWKEMTLFFQETDIGKKMKHIHMGTKLKECLMYNQETCIYRVLQVLVNVQNQFLDETLLVANTSEALHFLSVKENVFVFPSVQVTKTRKDDLIHFQSESETWGTILREESSCCLRYGFGSEIMYNFHIIETRLAMMVLTGKSFLDFRHGIPNIIFADELYINYADLLIELKVRVKQKSLTQEIIESVQNKKNDDPKIVKDLLTHLGIIMTLLKKTGGDPDAPLVDYVNKWGSILSHEFPRALLPNPETSVKLCHIVGLSECLEEICSETVLDALEKEYTEKLDDVACKHISHLLHELPVAKVLLKALKRFMYRGVFSQTADAHRPICNYLTDNSFWSDSCKERDIVKVGKTEETVQNLLPDYLMVCHIQCLIKQMEIEIEKKEKEAIRMSEMATDFRKAQEKRKPQSKALARKAKAKKYQAY